MPEVRKKLGRFEAREAPSSGDWRKKDAVLERTSSVGAYEEPRIKGVPRTLNRGVPILQDGMVTSRTGGRSLSISMVFGRWSSPGWVMTTLKPPGSDSRATLESGMVESDIARRCLWCRILICFWPGGASWAGLGAVDGG